MQSDVGGLEGVEAGDRGVREDCAEAREGCGVGAGPSRGVKGGGGSRMRAWRRAVRIVGRMTAQGVESREAAVGRFKPEVLAGHIWLVRVE